ncbi:hypothetical protein Tco_0164024 [Tanacetum coccineum]
MASSKSSLAIIIFAKFKTRCSSGRANNKVFLALTSFLLFCMSLAVMATVLPFFFAEASLATAFPSSSGGSVYSLLFPNLDLLALGYLAVESLQAVETLAVHLGSIWRKYTRLGLNLRRNKTRMQLYGILIKHGLQVVKTTSGFHLTRHGFKATTSLTLVIASK